MDNWPEPGTRACPYPATERAMAEHLRDLLRSASAPGERFRASIKGSSPTNLTVEIGGHEFLVSIVKTS